MVHLNQILTVFSIFLVFFFKSQFVGSSSYIHQYYTGSDEYETPICPISDGWNEYWEQVEANSYASMFNSFLGTDPGYEFDELCPKGEFTTCGCLYRDFAIELMERLNKRSKKMLGYEILPATNTGYQNYTAFDSAVHMELFTDEDDFGEFLEGIEDKLNISFAKNVCERYARESQNRKECEEADTFLDNLLIPENFFRIGTYLFAIPNYDKTGMSMGGSLPAVSFDQFAQDFKAVERSVCKGKFLEKDRDQKEEDMVNYIIENDKIEKNGEIFCPLVNGRRNLLDRWSFLLEIGKKLCPQRYRKLGDIDATNIIDHSLSEVEE